MIIDIIIIAVIVLFAAIGVKRGLAKTILNIAGIILSAVAAYHLASFLSLVIYDSMLKQTVQSNIQQLITQNGADYAFSNCLEAVPNWINGIISFIVGLFGVTMSDYQKQISFPQNLSATAAQSIEGAVSPIVTSILSILLVIVLFIIIFVLVKCLIRVVAGVFNIPIVKQINQLLGGIFGIAEGFLIVWLGVNIFSLVTGFSNPAFMNNEIFSGAVFKFFCMSV